MSEVSLNYILHTAEELDCFCIYDCVHLKCCQKYLGVSFLYMTFLELMHDYFINSWTMYLTCKICTVLMSAIS